MWRFALFFLALALSVIGIFLLAVTRDVFHDYAELGEEADDEDVEVDGGDNERNEPSAPPPSDSVPVKDDGPGAPPDVEELDSIAL